jgi:hypothetical protein
VCRIKVNSDVPRVWQKNNLVPIENSIRGHINANKIMTHATLNKIYIYIYIYIYILKIYIYQTKRNIFFFRKKKKLR